MMYAKIFVISAVGSFIQAVTGFGAAITMMLFFSHFMPITTATALNGIMCLGSNIGNTVTHRKHIQWKHLPWSVIAFFILSYVSIRLSKAMDTDLLKKIFGAVLIFLAVYFLFAAKKIHVKPTPLASIICGCISGITGGMFGASGPPLVVYFISATESKESYIGTLQAYCLVTGIWSLAVRLVNGFYTLEMIPLMFLGVAGVLVGQFIGGKVVNKISADTLRNFVYVMLAVSGLVNILG